MKTRPRWPAFGIIVTVVLSGCDGGGGGGGGGGATGPSDVSTDEQTLGTDGATGNEGSSPALAASDDNLPTVQATDAQIDRMLAEGADAPTICAEVAQSLQDDDRVAGAAVDPDIDAVWVDFVDGESQVFQIIDDTADSEGLIKDDTFALIKSVQNRNRNRPTPPVTQPRQFNPPNPADLIHLPAKDKALLANALSPFHANWDVTDTTEKLFAMLFDLGYEGKRVPLTLDLVETFGDYGVIVLETHGTWRDPIYPADQIKLPPGILDDSDNDTAPTNDNCGGNASRHVLLTTTRATGANLAPRAKEIFCGQLLIWNVHLRQKNGKVTKQANYGFTANYLREKVKSFGNYTIFVLNACRGFQADAVSGELLAPFQSALFDKTEKGATFLGWDARVRYPYAYRGVLNLFQMATTSNEEDIVKNITILEKPEPPWGGWDPGLLNTYAAVNSKGYLLDPTSGAQMLMVNQPPDVVSPYLMPHPQHVDFREDGDHLLGAWAESAPEVRVGETLATVTRFEGASNLWKFKLPVGAFGDITMSENFRVNGATRVIHRWKPQIKITHSSQYIQYTVTLTLLARATLSPDRLRFSMFEDAPEPSFSTVFEKEASFVGWQVTGQEQVDKFPDGVINITRTGSGQRALTEEDGSTNFWIDDNGTVFLWVQVGVPYTETSVKSWTGEVTTEQEELSLSVFREGIPLSASWTVGAQSYTEDIGEGDAQISWNAFAAEPPFDSDEEPR